ncbi:hypothetical protein D3C75_611810 [compost metagenome]
MATGVRMATTGVLFRKAEITRAVTVRPASTRVGLVPTRSPSQLPSASMQPVRSKAADSTNMQAMVTGAELDSTPSTSAGTSRPVTSRAATAMAATMSGLHFSRTKETSTQSSRAATNQSESESGSMDILGRISCEVSTRRAGRSGAGATIKAFA